MMRRPGPMRNNRHMMSVAGRNGGAWRYPARVRNVNRRGILPTLCLHQYRGAE
jgi:hypothetical protein